MGRPTSCVYEVDLLSRDTWQYDSLASIEHRFFISMVLNGCRPAQAMVVIGINVENIFGYFNLSPWFLP